MLTVAAYERREREFTVLKLLARGEREINNREGYDLAEVLAEADVLLAALDRQGSLGWDSLAASPD
jgi:hypothetical protein